MDEILYPKEISDTPLPGQVDTSTSVTQSTSSGVSSVATTKDNPNPTKKIAVELLSTSLNTQSKKILQSFDLVEQGAFRVGKYQPGVSGEVSMTPAGITAKNTSGVTTFALSGEDGSAIFAGHIQSGAVLTGLLVVGNNRLVLDGVSGRMIVNDGTNNVIAIGNLDF